MRRKKASRTASLSSLLLSHRDGDGALRSQLQMASPAPSTESATLERLNNARRWISESSLSTAASWTPGTVVVKECSCGNKGRSSTFLTSRECELNFPFVVAAA